MQGKNIIFKGTGQGYYPVDCRVWVYKGKEYNAPPKAMIIDSILREVYSDKKAQLNDKDDREPYQLPENLQQFFESIEKNKNVSN